MNLKLAAAVAASVLARGALASALAIHLTASGATTINPTTINPTTINQWERVQPSGANNALGGDAGRGVVANNGAAVFPGALNVYARTSWDEPWAPLSLQINGLNVAALEGLMATAVDPARVYASARLDDGQRHIVRSDDGGASFSSILQYDLPGFLFGLAAAPGDSDTLYAAILNIGLLKTSDGGLTWTTIDPNVPATLRDWAVDVQNANVVYALDGNVPVRSTDSGATFATSAAGIDPADTLGRLRTTVADANTLVVASLASARVYRSTDAAQTWAAMDVAPGLAPGAVTDVVIDPVDPSHLFVSAGNGQDAGLFETTDAGATWTMLADPGNSDGAGRLVFAADGELVSFGRSGVVRIVDGALVEANAGFNDVAFSGVRITGDDSAPWYGFSQSGGVAATAPATPQWTTRRPGLGIGVNDLAVDPQAPSLLWAATRNGLYRSLDGGAAWTAISIPDSPAALAVGVSATSSDTVYVLASSGLWATTDEGLSWQLGLASADFPAAGVRGPIVAARTAPGVAFAATNASGLLKTTDAGASWAVLPAPFAQARVNDVVLDPLRPAGLYVATDNAVWHSPDDGLNWTSITQNQSFDLVVALVADPVVRDRLYLRDLDGIWARDSVTGQWSLAASEPTEAVGAFVLGETIAGNGRTPGLVYDTLAALWRIQLDTDGDGIGDDVDTCLLTPNPEQFDGDGDGLGNVCDADIAPATNDCIVNVQDLGELRVAFFSTPDSPNWNPAADLNVDGVINVEDLGLMRQAFFQGPGLSAANTQCRPGADGG